MKEEKFSAHQRLEGKRRLKNFSIQVIFLFLLSICSKIQKVETSQIKLKIFLESNDPTSQKIMNKIDILEYKLPFSVIVNNNEITGFQETYTLVTGENNIIIKFDPETESCKGMFQGLEKIKEADLSNFDASHVKSMDYMFAGCIGLESINLRNIDTSSLVQIQNIFEDCTSLISVDLSDLDYTVLQATYGMFLRCTNLQNVFFGTIDAPELLKMGCMFQGCKALKSIDFSNANFPKLTDMGFVFDQCNSLISVNFNKINTPSVTTTEGLFQLCTSITSVDLSDFNFSKDTNMHLMFQGCSNLVNVDFGDIKTPELVNMDSMFLYCRSLKSLNFSTSDFSNVQFMGSSFCECNSLENIIFGTKTTSSLKVMSSLFRGCSSLPTLDLTIFETSQVTDLSHVFDYCKILPSLDVTKFNTENVVNMAFLFNECSGLSTLDVSHFDTSKVTDMSHLFSGCLLNTIDINNWVTSSVKTMEAMFYNCVNLENLILGTKVTSNVENMNALFQSCKKLSSIDLSSWDTGKVNNMGVMFFDCPAFKFLDLSKFRTPNINKLSEMFGQSTSLHYLNLKLFEKLEEANWEHNNVFLNLKEDTIICIDHNPTKHYLLDPEPFRLPYAICSDTCKIETNIKIDFDNQKCLASCEDSPTNKYDYKNRCLNTCPINTLMYNHLCIDNDCTEFAIYSIQCSEDGKPIGYYLDSNDDGATGVYKKCYNLCQTCEGPGDATNHNCLNCISGYRHLDDEVNDKNCYEDCPDYYYFDNSNVYHCTSSEVCPSEYNLFIPEKRKCIDQCEKDNTYKHEYHQRCYNREIIETTQIEETTNKAETTQIDETTNKGETTHIEETTNKAETTETKPIESTDLEETTSSPEEDLYDCFNKNSLVNKCVTKNNMTNAEKYNIITTHILASYSPSNFKSLLFEGEGNVIYQINNLKNELDLFKNNRLPDDYNMSIVDLGQCEAKLRQKYGIAPEDSLIIIKKETLSSQSSERDVEFEIFEPYNKTKLNLSFCEDADINVYVPFTLSEENQNLANELQEKGYNMFDLNDPFYQDYCSTFKTLAKTDMLLTDRVDHIYNNLDAKCQDNCVFSNYIADTNYINCSCNVYKQKTKEFKKVDKMDYHTFMQSFYYVLKYSNYKILQCYKLVFVKTVFSENKGSIFIFILFILYLICLIIYIKKGVNPLKKNMLEILEANQNGMIDIETAKTTLFFPPQKNKRTSLKKRQKTSVDALVTKNLEKKIKFEKEPKLDSKSPFFKDKNAKDKTNMKRYSSTKEASRIKRKSSKLRNTDNIAYRETQVDLKSPEEKQEQKKFDDFELNELPYEDAVKYDQRGWFKTYFALLKREHRIIFTFFVCNDYNILVVKLSRFIFLLATDIAMNVFFFSDATMHKIFLDYGKYNFVQQIPQILYSSIISQIIEVFLCFLSLTDKHIYEIKGLEIKTLDEKNKKIIQDVFNLIKKKLFFYFLFTFIFFLGYWYVVACFCAVYPNTQSIFLKDCLMSTLLSFLYPFILYTFPSAFRKCALRCKNNNCLFKVSEVIPFF